MLTLLFLQARWFSNMSLASEEIFAFETSIKQAQVKKGDKTQTREPDLLSSQIKQGLHEWKKQDIHGLAEKKKKGKKVGRLKFKKKVQRIPLKQYNNTYKIDSKTNKISIQNSKGWIKVHELKQISKEAKFDNAVFYWKHGVVISTLQSIR